MTPFRSSSRLAQSPNSRDPILSPPAPRRFRRATFRALSPQALGIAPARWAGLVTAGALLVLLRPDGAWASPPPPASGGSSAASLGARTHPPDGLDSQSDDPVPPLPPLPPLPEAAGAAPVSGIALSANPAPVEPGSALPPAAAAGDPAPAPPAPTRPVPENALPAATAPPLELDLSANRQSYDGQLQRFVATGNVRARIAGGRLLADRIEFDTNSRTIYAFGSVRFQRGQQYLQASRLRFSLPEGRGEMDDVYGVIDLDGTAQDLDLSQEPSAPLTAPEPMSCPPSLPPVPQWHPYPWAATVWGGQMSTANFGDTFTFRGSFRPESLVGIGLQRRILDAGPLAFEFDTNLVGHRASPQAGGPFNQDVPNARTGSQTFGELTAGIGARLWLQPWLSIYFVEGVSFNSEPSNYERTFRENYAQLLNYLAFEVEALVTPQLSAVGRIHHRSGAYGLYSGVSEGSNGYLVGLRYRFGQSPPITPPLELPPAQGCPGAPPPGGDGPHGLAEQLEMVTLGGPTLTPAAAGAPGATTGASGSTVRRRPPQNPWALAREQERRRNEAIARIDQRVRDVRFQQSLIAERRYGFPTELNTPDAANQFGQVRPQQLQDLTTKSNRQLLRGTISRWRVQARRLRFTPSTLEGDRVGFSNDPFTPAQSWMDSENVVATLQPNGDTIITASRNRVILEDRLPIPAVTRTRVKKEQEVDNRLVIGVDKDDRDGIFLGYNIPYRIGEKGSFTLQPQFMLQRAIDGNTDSYPLPGQPQGSPNVSQPNTVGDLFGVRANLNLPVAGFIADATLNVSTFNPDNIADGTRSFGDLARAVVLPGLGESLFRLFGAYRFRTWNGSLGEQDVYAAYGVSLEQRQELPAWGRLRSNYFWRVGVGNYKANAFDTTNLAALWRANAIGSLNLILPLWQGKPAPATVNQGLANTAVPVVPGLTLNANILGTLAYFGDGTNQNTIGFSAGPTLTLGHFIRPFFDYTQITITGGGTLRQGLSPFSFDSAVDLSTLGIGLTQQIVGPLVFSGGIGLNVDARSEFYGDVTNSYLELRWQRRSYEIGIYYSPYDGLGGIRVKLNDFNFSGPGVPFVPYNAGVAPGRNGGSPGLEAVDRPF